MAVFGEELKEPPFLVPFRNDFNLLGDATIRVELGCLADVEPHRLPRSHPPKAFVS